MNYIVEIFNSFPPSFYRFLSLKKAEEYVEQLAKDDIKAIAYRENREIEE